MKNNPETRCGYVTITGRPNVGKSTLLNQILKKKLSITSRKPQTTRHCLLGVQTENDAQAIFVDTPGIQTTTKKQLNRYMNTVAFQALVDMDVILFVVEALTWKEEDEFVLKKLTDANVPILLVVNKVDSVRSKDQLLPFLAMLNEKAKFEAVYPISAKTGQGVDNLQEKIKEDLPKAPFLFPEDAVTDRQNQFIATEMIREQLMRYLGDEIPYSVTVGIEQYKEEGNLLRIYAVIYVERDGQKVIIIGKKGESLKRIGTQARKHLESYFEKKVFLQLWVKVKKGWTDDPKLLKRFGYEDSF